MRGLRLIAIFLIFLCSISEMPAQSKLLSVFQDGKKAYMNGNYSEAVSNMKQIIDKEPNYANAYIILYKSYLQMGEFERMVKECDHLVKTNVSFEPEDKASLYDILAQGYLKSENIREAIAAEQFAIRLTMDDKSRNTFKENLQNIENLKKNIALKYYKMAMDEYSKGNYKACFNYYQTGMKTGYRDNEYHRKYLEIKKEFDLKNKQQKAQEYITKAERALAQKDWDEAKKMYQFAASEWPENDDLLKKVKMVLDKEAAYYKKIEEEKSAEQRESDRKSELVRVINIAKMKFKNEQWEEAMKYAQRGKDIDPSNRELSDILSRAKECVTLEKSYRSGMEALEKENWDSAISQLKRVYDKIPESLDKCKSLAKAYEGKQEYELACNTLKEYWNKMGSLEKKKNKYILKKMYDYSSKYDKKQAVKILSAYFKYDEDDELTALKLIDIMELVDQEGTETFIKDYLRNHPTCKRMDRMLVKLAALMKRMNKPENEVIEVYEKLIKNTDNSTFILEGNYELGAFLFEAGRFPESQPYLEKAYTLDPEYKDGKLKKYWKDVQIKKYMPAIYFLGGCILLVIFSRFSGGIGGIGSSEKKKAATISKARSAKVKNDYKLTVKLYSEILAKFSLTQTEAKECNLSLANANLKLGDYNSVMGYAEKVLELERENISAHKAIATSYFKQKQFDSAIRQCRMVFEFTLSDKDIHKIMEAAYKHKGNLEELVMEYEELANLNPDDMTLRNQLLKVKKEFELSKKTG